MSEVSIRLATVEDVPEIHRLLTELAFTLGKQNEIKSEEQDLLQHGFGAHPRFEAMLAFENDEAVGLVVFFSEYSTWRGEPGVYVQDLYVTGKLRGSGLGRQLIFAVREHAGRCGAKYMKLTVYDRSQDAISFYRHLGFELCEDEIPLVLRET